jgi:hypothetical protein
MRLFYIDQLRVAYLFASIIFSGIHSIAQQNVVKNSHVNYDSLRMELEAMYDADQDIRRILVDSIGFNSPETPKYMNKIAEIDAENQAKLQVILEKYGWIGQSKIGEKAAEGIFYIVQHAPLEMKEKYFPQFKKLAIQGEAKRTQCAMMEDRILMMNGKKQIYGTQANNNIRPDKKFVIWPIENPAAVNELRKKAGFDTTVEENARRLNAEYNPDEKLPSTNK